MSIDGKRRLAAAAFVVLLALSVFWPGPAIGINQLCCHARLTVDNLSFLGREAPAWDVAFWCIAGLFAPAMVVLFFLIAGVAYRHHRWIAYAVAMAFAGAAAGVAVQIVKYTAGRTRPELWLGPFQHARASATSFPSGHTVGAFALAGVLMLNSESKTMRVVAALLAIAVAVSRVLAFRHWTSDVTASAAIGILAAWVLSDHRRDTEGTEVSL